MQIPTLNESNVTASTVLPTPQRSGASPVAQGLGALGGATQGAGNELMQLAQEQKYKTDTARVDEIHSATLGKIQQLNYDTTIDPTDKQPKGLLLKQGKSAIGIAASGETQIQALLNEATNGVTDPQQLALLKHRLSSIIPDESLSYHREEAKQTEAYRTSTATSLISALENQLPTLATQPERFEETFKAKQAKVLELAEQTGMDAAIAVRESADKTIKETVQYLAKLGNPETAQAFLKNNTDRLTPGTYAALELELAPAIRARKTDGFAQKALEAGKDPKYPDAPVDEEKAVASLKGMTSDPEELKLAREKIHQARTDHDQSLLDKYNYYGKTLIEKWESNPSLTVLDIMKEPEFGKLDKGQRGTIEAKIRQSIEHRDTTERQTKAAERSASAAARAAATAAAKELREASENSAYKLIANQERLSNMSDDQYKVERAGLRPQDQVKTDEARAKVKDPKHLKDINSHKEMVDKTLSSIPGLKGDELKILSGYILHKLIKLQKDKGGLLTDDETRDATIKFARIQWVEEGMVFKDTVAKRAISVSGDDKVVPRPATMQARLDAVAKKHGKAKLSTAEETALEQAIVAEDAKK